jgi:hypothetical protein
MPRMDHNSKILAHDFRYDPRSMHLNNVWGVASGFEAHGSSMCQTVDNIEYNITVINEASHKPLENYEIPVDSEQVRRL